MRRFALATLALSFVAVPHAAVAGGGCVVPAPAQEVRATTIRADRTCFAPLVALVAPGATVTWTNPADGLPHNLSGPAIRHAELPPGATESVRFDRPGIYPFACTIHPGMSGAVIVRDAAAAVPDAAAPAAGSGGTNDLPWGRTAAAAGLGAAVLGAAAVLVVRTSRARGVPQSAR